MREVKSLKKRAHAGLLAAVAVVLLLLIPTAALAQTDPYSKDPKDPYSGQSIGGSSTVRGATETRGDSGDSGILPFTGANMTWFILAGVGLTSLGLLIVRSSRSE